jgi:hypothetical protein
VVAKPTATAVCAKTQKRAGGCLHVRYVDSCPEPLRLIEPFFESGFERSTFEDGSGRSSNDGSESIPLPARSDGLDNVDGGPDAAFYIQIGII